MSNIVEQNLSLTVHVTNMRQILLVPVLGIECLSSAVRIYDFPILAEYLGAEVIDVFKRLKNQTLDIDPNQKNYWVRPKGIRSWRQFQSCSISLTIETSAIGFSLFRYYAVPPNQGFAPESAEPNQILSHTVSPLELGEAILKQLAHIQMHPYKP